MIPIKDTIPSRSYPIVNVLIIITNCLVFFFELSLGYKLNKLFLIFGINNSVFASTTSIWPLRTISGVSVSVFENTKISAKISFFIIICYILYKLFAFLYNTCLPISIAFTGVISPDSIIYCKALLRAILPCFAPIQKSSGILKPSDPYNTLE